jgi:hypothetical protein
MNWHTPERLQSLNWHGLYLLPLLLPLLPLLLLVLQFDQNSHLHIVLTKTLAPSNKT